MKLAVVCPCYNEEAVIADSVSRLNKWLDGLVARQKIAADSFVVMVNDGSRDATWTCIEEAHQANPRRFKGVNLSRNVGHQQAIMAGMMTAYLHADAVITIDVDLQDDLQAMEEMVDRYAEGYDIVYGVKVSREADPFIKRTTALAFYRLQSWMGIKAIYNHADFRLMSRRAVEQLTHYQERNLYLRGIIPLLGYPSTTVDDVIRERTAGVSKYTMKKMLRLAVDGITSFSTKPISMIVGMGLLCLLISIGMFVYVLASYWEHRVVAGWPSLMLSLWFIGGLLLLAIGIIGEYIGKIYIEVKRRPLYTIERTLWNEEKTDAKAAEDVRQ